MDFSKLDRSEVLGVFSSLLLIVSVLALPWYGLDQNPARDTGEGFLCGQQDYTCTGWETFPILRWLLLAGASAPLILAWIVIRGHKLSWAPGEMTMTVGFTALVLVGYNGVIDRPGSGIEEIGNSLDYGYWLALLATISIAAAGYWRSVTARGKVARKAPGTV